MMRAAVLVMCLIAVWLSAAAQRTITPVQPGKPPAAAQARERRPDMSKLAHYKDADGNIVLVDTVTGTEVPDTLLRAAPKMEYPLLHSLTVGVNIWDAVMRAFGQKYGIGDASVALGLHNRYFPTFEAGVSEARDTPAGLNYSYESPLAPYFKIGCDYNFFYNSNPAYKLLAGVRYGITAFRYGYTDIHITDSYWDTTTTLSIPRGNCTAGYLELLLGIRVKIAGGVMMGWAFKYHSLLHHTTGPEGDPMTVPGYGKTTGSITGAMSVFYTFTLDSRRGK